MNKRYAVILAAVVGLVCSLATFIVMTIIENADPFNEVGQLIGQKYLHEYSTDDVRDAGLKAMVAELKDPYSVYYTAEEYKSYTQQVAGEYVGLGMVIKKDDTTGYAKVDSFIEGSPAETSGVKAGDLIISVNGEDVTGKSLVDISTMCTGDEGTSVKIGIKRGDDKLEFEIVRKSLSRNMVTYKMLSDGIGYMDISQFGGSCEQQFNDAMSFFQKNSAKGIVVDLRDDPGGYLNTVVEMLDKLLPEGTIVYTEDKNKHRETWKSDAASIKIPMTLIVNGNTASAAEIFAGAIQDYNYGKIVGTTTYGKGVVQEMIPIKSTGGGMKITISQYFTPKGRTINGNGIYPDYYVQIQQAYKDNPSDYSFDNDAQVLKAIEVLKDTISANGSQQQ
jgi:carboxyl-terminal processing protease